MWRPCELVYSKTDVNEKVIQTEILISFIPVSSVIEMTKIFKKMCQEGLPAFVCRMVVGNQFNIPLI